MTNQHLFKFFLISAILAPGAMGFVVSPLTTTFQAPPLTALQAKKKKGQQAGKGFGKEPPKPAPSSGSNSNPANEMATTTTAPTSGGSFLQSVEGGGSDAIPTIEAVAASSSDPALPPEERAKKVLREQYGMRTLQEQRTEDSIQENRRKLDELKKLAEKGEDFDIMAMVPAPILKGIDTFLKLGVGVCTILFVTAGLGITLEAWSKTSNSPLPDNIDDFIVNVVEPNFTYGLFVLLGFCVGLGGFLCLHLSSGSATYKEE